jgi:hypothetical protein
MEGTDRGREGRDSTDGEGRAQMEGGEGGWRRKGWSRVYSCYCVNDVQSQALYICT